MGSIFLRGLKLHCDEHNSQQPQANTHWNCISTVRTFLQVRYVLRTSTLMWERGWNNYNRYQVLKVWGPLKGGKGLNERVILVSGVSQQKAPLSDGVDLCGVNVDQKGMVMVMWLKLQRNMGKRIQQNLIPQCIEVLQA